jgi:hypothetical protein
MTRQLGSPGDWDEWLEVTVAAGEGEEETHGYILSLTRALLLAPGAAVPSASD